MLVKGVGFDFLIFYSSLFYEFSSLFKGGSGGGVVQKSDLI